MIEKKEAIEKLSELTSDIRLTYPCANVFINAPLALIQADLMARINTYEFVLGMKLSKLSDYEK